MPHLGMRLKELREERGLTQEALAKVLAVSRGCVSNWEHGLQSTPDKHVAPLASILKVPEAYLRGRTWDYVPERLAASKSLRCLAWRPLELPPYPIKGNLQQMLGLGAAARELHGRARERHPPEMLRALDGTWFRDSVLELMGAFHLVAAGARVCSGTLDQMGCPLLPIDHVQTWRNASHAARDCLVLEHGRARLIAFPQVWLALPRSPRCCRTDLLAYYGKGSQGIWLDIEFDGSQHVDYHQADAERAAALGLPRLGYANARVRCAGLAALILEDAALALEREKRGRQREGRVA